MSTKSKLSLVKRKPTSYEDKINEIVLKGGKTILESTEIADEEIRFTIRVPKSIVNKIDFYRKKRPGHVSRNQWILESLDYNIADHEEEE